MDCLYKLDSAWHVLLGKWRLRRCTRVGVPAARVWTSAHDHPG